MATPRSDTYLGTVGTLLYAGIAPDVTAPTLSGQTGTQTGLTTATGQVTTNEANGTLYAVVTTSSTAPSAAQVRAGQTNTGSTAAWSGNQSISTTGAKTFNATGLANGTTYYFHFHQRDISNNDSSVVTSSSFTTQTPDVTAPTLTSPTSSSTGTTTAAGGVTTNEANGTLYAVVTTSSTQPTAAQIRAGQTNTGATAPWAGNQSVSSTGAKSFTATGLTATTAYYFHFHHRDASLNDSAVSTSASFTTDTPGALREITTVTVASLTGSAQTNVPITFGQPFAQGDFDPVEESLYAKIDGVDVPIQFDAVSTFADGSARLAVVSAQVASLAGNATRTMQLYAGASFTQPTGSFSSDGWDPVVVLTISGATWTATPRAQLLSQLGSNTGIRLNGPVAKELRVSVPFKNTSNVDHAHLRAYFDVRFYSNGSIRTDLIIENGWLLQASPADVTYSLVCTQGAGGSNIFTQASFTHHHHARWHRVFWNGTQPSVRPRHNKNYFLDSKITWNYNRSLTVASGALDTVVSNLSMGGSGPMASGGLTVDMPGTGGRDEIAPIPKWSAMWVLSQDERAFTAMTRNADGAAAAPVHYRDQTSGLPVDLVSRPNIALRYGTSSPSVPTASSTTTWTPDIAHQGSYFFIPYVVTGDYFYLEEMTFWAGWNVAANDPAGRGAGHFGTEQLRGASWGFRSVLECAFALPDNHAQKTYFNTLKSTNISFFNSNFTSTSDNMYVFPLGGMKGIYNNNEIPGYENDFMMYVISWAIENGETGLNAMFNNVGRYVVDRFLAATQAAGFCTSKAAHYWNVSRSGGTPFTTWSAYATANGDGPTCGTVANGDGAYPDWAEGYAAVSRGMLGAATNAGHPNALEAYNRWLTFTPNLASDFVNSPQYNIVPR